MHTEATGARHVVILVEDEALIRMCAHAVLEDAGFDVVEVERADQAVEVLRARASEIHAVFTDVHMPGAMDGIELVHLARRCWPWIALLVASGRAAPRPADLPDGTRFLSKPYDPDHMIRQLRDLMAA